MGQTAQQISYSVFPEHFPDSCRVDTCPMFCVGDEFKSYADLKEKIHAFERAEFVQLNVQRSRSIDSASKRMPSKVYNEDLQYAETDFVCAHRGKNSRLH